MNEENFAETEKTERKKRTIGERALSYMALGSSVLALAGIFQTSQAEAEGPVRSEAPAQIASPNHQQSLESLSSLIPISELPGYGKEVTKQQTEQLKNSTVKIFMDRKMPGGGYSNEIGSGIKVMINGQEYILTSAHIFADLTGASQGIMKGSPKAANFIDLAHQKGDHFDFTVVDPQVPFEHGGHLARDEEKIAKVTGIVMSLDNKDIALLKVQSETARNITTTTASGQSETLSPRPWEKIPAIHYKSAQNLQPGQEVVSCATPNASSAGAGGKEICITGTLVGTYDYRYQYNGAIQRMAVVATSPRTPAEDPGLIGTTASGGRGGSGSGATAANGQYLGTLSESVNVGYGPHHINANPEYPLKDARWWWADIQKQTGVQISQNKFRTLLLYSMPKPDDLSSLAKGFSKHITKAQWLALKRQ